MLQSLLWLGLIILLMVAIYEIWRPKFLTEGFDNLIAVGDSAFWAKWMPRRGDVGPNPTEEQSGYIRDTRYFNGYADVQRIGVNHDFCRMVQVKGDPDDMFFACALAATDGLSTIKYRSPSTKDGFELSRDDYMRDVLDEGRDSYCRIVKVDQYTFEPKCNPASDDGFRKNMITDTSPPPDIKILMEFYQGIVFWLRFRDDMLDYAKNIKVAYVGNMEIQEAPPNPATTEGLSFNGIDQYLKIGDTKDLEFGDVVQLKYLRAVSFWVYFDEFTNNAHILDFGNGAGKDNIFVGIIGRGNADVANNSHKLDMSSSACAVERASDEAQVNFRSCALERASADAIGTVPTPPSGAQCTEVISPKEAMETSPANVNEWDCPKPEIFGKIMKPIQPKSLPPGIAKSADLVYEIWDHQQRKMHIQIKNAIPLQKWVHITITADNSDAFRPDISVWRNGEKIFTQRAGWLPQTDYTTSNYIGKSNWANVTSPYENADELFKGKLFDVRGYRTPMNKKKIENTYKWGKKLLGLGQLAASKE